MASSPYQGSCFAKQRVAVSFKLEGSLVLFPDLVSGFVTLLAGFVSVGIRALRSSGLPILFFCLLFESVLAKKKKNEKTKTKENSSYKKKS